MINYCFGISHDSNITLPLGAITKANPERNEFMYNPTNTWKTIIVNHTEKFNLKRCSRIQAPYLMLNDLPCFLDKLHEDDMKHFLKFNVVNSQITAYCIEDLPKLFFFEIEHERKGFLYNTWQIDKYFVNTEEPCLSRFIARKSDAKLLEIKEYICNKRKFHLILNTYRDQNPIFHDLNIPKEVISKIAVYYFNILK